MTHIAQVPERFAEVVADFGWRTAPGPEQLAGQWEQVVDLVEAGYEDNIYEYHNDLTVRGLIDRLLTDEELRGDERLDGFRARIAQVDTRLRNLLTSAPVHDIAGPWWETRVPVYAGEELAKDLRDRYGVDVEVR
ncbi:hypothetical protein [Amycolatopsis magusensis]|uniref:Uncharacterized protein n=1 Tax=Amycolatopsis magusensis TaxID=882444 RepID=A0ABS4Q1F1_9PSEU|nr:hypothetical protein [Amycolatopsis magusensis]MBP2185505.1 hypothetical protein [Amycolatopsis magusensis]MDI5976473.1 hypothetical protein [Amycolatopsis magusensis]